MGEDECSTYRKKTGSAYAEPCVGNDPVTKSAFPVASAHEAGEFAPLGSKAHETARVEGVIQVLAVDGAFDLPSAGSLVLVPWTLLLSSASKRDLAEYSATSMPDVCVFRLGVDEEVFGPTGRIESALSAFVDIRDRGCRVPAVVLLASRRCSTAARRLTALFAIAEVVYVPAALAEIASACVRAHTDQDFAPRF